MNAQDRPSYRRSTMSKSGLFIRSQSVARSLECPNSDLLAARLLFLILLLISVCLFATSPLAAQAEPAVEGDLCAEMLALLEAEPGDAEASSDLADRCSRPLDLRLLMSASAIREASGGAPGVCAPVDSEVTLSRIAEIFFSYGSQFRKSLYEDPYALLVEALEEKYPCPAPSLKAATGS